MKPTLVFHVVIGLLLCLQGCEKKTTEVVHVAAEALSPPLGLKSTAGHKHITLSWYTSNYETDFNGYQIYVLDSLYSDPAAPQHIPDGFTKIDSLPRSSPCNTTQSTTIYNLQNDTTYSFLVVAARDDWTKISQPSNIIYDTPRLITYDEALSSPLGLKSITGDREITLLWYTSNYESDLSGYEIYMVDSLYSEATAPAEIPSEFEKVSSHPKSSPCNTIQSRTISNLTNGTTYSFLVVAARDSWSKISQPSNIITDTPRRETTEGEYDTIWASVYIARCGYELSDFSVTDMSDIHTPEYYTDDGEGDFICELFNCEGGVEERLRLAGTNGGGMMDLGYMKDWNEADIAPDTGYAETSYFLSAIPGHVYAIKTGDNHYGKLHVLQVNVSARWLSFKACYQTKAGERQYKIRP